MEALERNQLQLLQVATHLEEHVQKDVEVVFVEIGRQHLHNLQTLINFLLRQVGMLVRPKKYNQSVPQIALKHPK